MFYSFFYSYYQVQIHAKISLFARINVETTASRVGLAWFRGFVEIVGQVLEAEIDSETCDTNQIEQNGNVV